MEWRTVKILCAAKEDIDNPDGSTDISFENTGAIDISDKHSFNGVASCNGDPQNVVIDDTLLYKDDIFRNMRVTKITNKAVLLTSGDGAERFIIRKKNE